VICASFLLFLGGLISNRLAKEPWLVVLLLSIPVITQLIGIAFIYWRDHIRSFSTYYAWMMGICVFTTYVLWSLYNWVHESLFLSVIAVSATIIIAAFVILMTIAIMRVPASNDSGQKVRLVNLRSDVQQEPFLALLLFFSAFLCVSYLFGLAFAFYDKTMPHNGKPALFMKNLYAEPTGSPNPDPKASAPQSEIRKEASAYKIYFRTAKAVPEIGDFEIYNVPAEAWRRNPKEIKETVNLRKSNHETFTALIDKVKEGTENDGRIRIMLTGRADDTSTVGTPYSSNYELSQARAQNVEMKILENLAKPLVKTSEFRWRNIEWVIDPVSNEPDAPPLDALFPAKEEVRRNNGSNAANRIVEIRVEPVEQEFASVQMTEIRNQSKILPYKQLDLMDYIYFANYTITTTGYGDIMPTTPYSKFLCSLANIFEVFFLVVFFNTLLSTRKGDEAATPRPVKHDPSAVQKASANDQHRGSVLRRVLESLGLEDLISTK
jgi:hypothetical protein